MGFWLDQRWKDTFIYASWHTCENPYVILCAVCQGLSLKWEEKIMVFPYLCFIQQDAQVVVPEFDSFIYHWRSTHTLHSNNVTTHRRRPCDWCLETVISVEVDLFFLPVLSDSPNPSQSHGRWGCDPLSPCWLKRTQLCSRGQAELSLIPLYTPLRTGGAGKAKHAQSLPMRISHVRVLLGKKEICH